MSPRSGPRLNRIAVAPSIRPSAGCPGGLAWATEQIAKLAEQARSESVRLAALAVHLVRHDGRL